MRRARSLVSLLERRAVLVAAGLGLLLPLVVLGLEWAFVRSGYTYALSDAARVTMVVCWPLAPIWESVGPGDEGDFIKGAVYFVPFSVLNAMFFASPTLIYRGVAQRRWLLLVAGLPLTVLWVIWGGWLLTVTGTISLVTVMTG